MEPLLSVPLTESEVTGTASKEALGNFWSYSSAVLAYGSDEADDGDVSEIDLT